MFAMNSLYALLFVSGIVLGDLKDLSFGGDGKEKCDPNGNCEYFFSNGFQEDICGVGSMTKMLSKWEIFDWKPFASVAKDKWCAQGVSVSQNGDYVARVFYEGGAEDYTNYVAVSIIQKGGSVKYSNILIAQPDNDKSACHAGDVVLTQLNDGVYWVLIACSSWIMAFSEQSIQKYSKGYEVNAKKFYYRVLKDDVKEIYQEPGMAISLSWISRNQGTVNQFWTGKCDYGKNLSGDKKTIPHCLEDALGNGVNVLAKDCNWDLNLKLITIDVGNTWTITNVQDYTIDRSAQDLVDLIMVQGATRIGNYMYLSKADTFDAWNNYIWKCPIIGTKIGKCQRICELAMMGTGYIQGAEVDDAGNLYVGSEFGQLLPFYKRAPWWIISDLSKKGVFGFLPCLPLKVSSYFDAEPYINIEPEERPPNTIYTNWGYMEIGLVLLFGAAMFTSGMSLMGCFIKTNKSTYYSSVKTISNDDESDV